MSRSASPPTCGVRSYYLAQWLRRTLPCIARPVFPRNFPLYTRSNVLSLHNGLKLHVLSYFERYSENQLSATEMTVFQHSLPLFSLIHQAGFGTEPVGTSSTFSGATKSLTAALSLEVLFFVSSSMLRGHLDLLVYSDFCSSLRCFHRTEPMVNLGDHSFICRAEVGAVRCYNIFHNLFSSVFFWPANLCTTLEDSLLVPDTRHHLADVLLHLAARGPGGVSSFLTAFKATVCILYTAHAIP